MDEIAGAPARSLKLGLPLSVVIGGLRGEPGGTATVVAQVSGTNVTTCNVYGRSRSEAVSIHPDVVDVSLNAAGEGEARFDLTFRDEVDRVWVGIEGVADGIIQAAGFFVTVTRGD